MQNQPVRTQQPLADTDARKEFAAEQSRQDRQSAVEYTKAILQLLIGGSGFLSTALVAIIATHKDKPFSQPLMLLPLLASVAAVMCGMVGAQLLFLSKQAFALRWEWVFFGYHGERLEGLLKDGMAKQKWGIKFFWLGFILFGVAAVLAAILFPRQS
jgi:hypothetical protein